MFPALLMALQGLGSTHFINNERVPQLGARPAKLDPSDKDSELFVTRVLDLNDDASINEIDRAIIRLDIRYGSDILYEDTTFQFGKYLFVFDYKTDDFIVKRLTEFDLDDVERMRSYGSSSMVAAVA